MIQDDEYLQTLRDLGLTLLQARTYLALCKTGPATAKTISKTSNIARQNTYRILPTLEKIGLVEKIITTPTTYKATPIKEGYSLLLQNKTKENNELQKKTIELIEHSCEIDQKTALQEEAAEFVVTTSETLLFKRTAEREKTVQKSICVVGRGKGIRSRLFYLFPDLKRALKRGVRIRIITEKYEGDRSVQKIIQTLEENPLFEIRYLSAPVPIKTIIHDDTEANMCIATQPTNDFPCLWSNNPQFVKVMKAYFEDLWNKAQATPEISITKKVKSKQPCVKPKS
jgi:sugar-specific transcriptional regulator TrmB